MQLLGSRTFFILFVLLLGLFFSACSAVKRVPEGEYLLVKNKFQITGDEKGLDKTELKEIVKQQPNKRILGIRFHLTMYNWPNPDKLEKRRDKQAAKRQQKEVKRAAKRQRKNEKRAIKGKPPKSYKPKDYKRIKGQWLQEVVGRSTDTCGRR